MNPRILIMAKVLVGNCQLLPEEADSSNTCLSNLTNSNGDRVDTFTNEEKSAFLRQRGIVYKHPSLFRKGIPWTTIS